MTNPIQFFVPGQPKTAGSKRAFMRPGMKFPVIVDDCAKGKDWRGDVKRFAVEAFRSETLVEGPLTVSLTFIMPRPKYHYRSNGELKDNAPALHTSKPDVLKMARAIEDALTGVVWKDDSQIAVEVLTKRYGDKPGCQVSISRLQEKPETCPKCVGTGQFWSRNMLGMELESCRNCGGTGKV